MKTDIAGAMLVAVMVLTGGSSGVLWAGTPHPWLGRHFPPEQRTPLTTGEVSFQRKLCRIVYQIRAGEAGIQVAAALYFTPRFVPRRPKAVTLEILLLDASGVCIDLIDREVAVTAAPVTFRFTVTNPAVRSVRTYYTLHYPGEA
ncbi:MAG: hypothetical protein QNJ22_20695 [Desulfosarcinaceae bacterium]|nr:hypothetical protein [Desulfosarcinaceae bacterium]